MYLKDTVRHSQQHSAKPQMYLRRQYRHLLPNSVKTNRNLKETVRHSLQHSDIPRVIFNVGTRYTIQSSSRDILKRLLRLGLGPSQKCILKRQYEGALTSQFNQAQRVSILKRLLCTCIKLQSCQWAVFLDIAKCYTQCIRLFFYYYTYCHE